MRRWLISIIVGMGVALEAGLVQAQVDPAPYQAAMVTYKQRQAQFDRDRQLYQAGSNTDFATVLSSANAAFVARQQAAYRYTFYLRSLVQNYVTDEEIARDLLDRLDHHAQEIAQMTVNFNTLTDWSTADSAAATIMAGLHETAYQCFAQVYYLELSGIVTNYLELYQTQRERILREASSAIDRQNKTKILDETNRTLLNLQTQVAAAKPNLNFINSASSYASLREKLDNILTDCEKSLEVYAQLE